ncbi:MAG: 16S rRNA (cytidine(1402)-2'-O)-methyltransferase [Robiginitomaculum sp.]
MPEFTNTDISRAPRQVQDAIAQSVQLASGLYLVATPVGNLRDITLRALDTLRSADLVLAEDTRTSAKLMQAYNLKPVLSAYHDHNAAKRVPNLVTRIKAGAAIALISDAGTPLVSDPGYKLARACIDEDLPVYAVPGASSVLSAIVSAGLPSDKFMFAGFLPTKSAARIKALQDLQSVPASLVFFESVRRLSKMLADVYLVFGNRNVAIARELTKKYEEILRGTAKDLIDKLGDKILRGEIVVVIGPPERGEVWSDAQIIEALEQRIKPLGMKRASEEIAVLSGHKKRDVYQLALKLKNDR